MRVGLLVAVAVATYLLFPVGAVVESPVFEMGSVATRDVIAPFAFDVPKPADQLARERDDAARSVRPVLVYRSDAADSAARRLGTIMDSLAAAQARPGNDADSVQRAAASAGITLSPAAAEYLASA